MIQFSILLLVSAAGAWAANVNTFSIVAYDPANGDCGITVASRYFVVGSVVPWAEAGVGCIAIQANVNVGYGPRGLELPRQGMNAKDVLTKLLGVRDMKVREGRLLFFVAPKPWRWPSAPPCAKPGQRLCPIC
jgi:Family of unknown function (DUF1028)